METVIKEKYTTLNYNGKILVGSTDDEKYYVLTMEGEKIKRLPKGYAILFDPEYKNYDKRIFVGDSDEDGYVMLDEQGNEIDTQVSINNISMSYYWGVNVPNFFPDEYEEEMDTYDYEYEEEEED